MDGTIPETGLLSPIRHVPSLPFIDELEKRNIEIIQRVNGNSSSDGTGQEAPR